MIKWLSCALLITITYQSYAMTNDPARLVRPQEVLSLETQLESITLSYGELEQQFGKLRLPAESRQHDEYPLTIVIHGGCWNSEMADYTLMEPFADSLAQSGIATWNIEYRCTDNGGGWPGTFLDIAQAVDYVRVIAKKYPIALNKVIVIGHSSGGHLALWSAARHKLNSTSELYTTNPLPLLAAVNIAGPGDLQAFRPMQKTSCGFNAVDAIFHDEVNNQEIWQQASPSELLPFNVMQLLITGEQDQAMPPQIMQQYAKQANVQGDISTTTIIPNCGHFDYLDPSTEAFAAIHDSIHNILQTKSK